MLDTASSPPPSSASAEDQLLAAWAQHGDRRALSELFGRCRRPAFALAVRICGRSAADDAVQEGFLQAMRHARSWRGGSARGWLLVTVANAARNHQRGETRRINREAVLPLPAPESPVDPDLAEAIRAALGELPGHERSAIELHYFAGLDLAQAAAALDRPYKTVHSQITRGLDHLRDILGRQGITASAAAVSSTLLAPMDATEPPGLAVALDRLAADGPAPASSWGLALPVGLGVSALLLALAWRSPFLPASQAQASAATPPVAIADPLQAVLDQPVSVRFLHDKPREALDALARALPADAGFRYVKVDDLEVLWLDWHIPGMPRSLPERGRAKRWDGITWKPAGMATVRQALDAVTTQAGLAWTTRGGMVVVHPSAIPSDETELDAVLAALRREAEPQPSPADTAKADEEDLGSCAMAEGSAVVGIKETERILLAGVSRPNGMERIVVVGLDPLRPAMGRRIFHLVNRVSCWFTSQSVSAHELPPSRVLAGSPSGDAAVRCLRALAGRTGDLRGVRCQALLAAQVAAAAGAAGAADAISAVLGHDDGPEDFQADLRWRTVLGECLAVLRDPRAVPVLVETLQSQRRGSGRAAIHGLALVGATDVLISRGEIAALGWCPEAIGLPLIQQRIAGESTITEAYEQALGLLQAGARSIPPVFAAHLQHTEKNDKWPTIGTAMIRCGGAAGVEPLLALAERDAEAIGEVGQVLALVEDPQALPLLSRELAGAVSARAEAAAIGLASCRLPGAGEALLGALATLPADDPRTLALWRAALGGRNDELASAALAETVRRGASGFAILRGLASAGTPAALEGGWAMVDDPRIDLALRLEILQRLPKNDMPARERVLNAILGDRTGPPELRAVALLEGAAARIPACAATIRAAAADDPSGWVRACALFAGNIPIGKDAEKAAFFAERLRRDPSPQARCYAAAGLDRCAKDAEVMIQTLATEPHPRVRETIARLLAQNVFVAKNPARTAAVRAAAERCVATETDPEARAALEALRIGGDPGPAKVGRRGDSPWGRDYRMRFTNVPTGRSWERRIWPPSQLDDSDDPGLPFSDG